ncbi:bifunctional RNase H/acid phosphatase, partial [Streptomyces sp. SID7982]|nr:bifunctional RNase H/acid phosphatase [Streptomyces sp. SID7982]
WEASASTAALDAPAAVVDTPAADALFSLAEEPAESPLPEETAESGGEPTDAHPAPQQTAGTPQTGWGAAPDLGAPATLVLLRHGETALTPEKRFSGSGGTDPELSAVGRGQAERAAAHFAALGTVQEIVSSPLRRCRETAAAVAARLGLDVRIDESLR